MSTSERGSPQADLTFRYTPLNSNPPPLTMTVKRRAFDVIKLICFGGKRAVSAAPLYTRGSRWCLEGSSSVQI